MEEDHDFIKETPLVAMTEDTFTVDTELELAVVAVDTRVEVEE